MLSQKESREALALLKKTRYGNEITSQAISDFLYGLDTPRALTCWLMYYYGEHDQLAKLDVDPRNYLEAVRFRDDYAATKFLSKASFLKTTFNRKEVAMAAFWAAEARCRDVNRRFRSPLSDSTYRGPNVWLLNATKQKIARILGVTDISDSIDAEEFIDACDWGPGVTSSLRGCHVSATNKFQSETGITRDCFHFVSDLFPEAYPSWSRHLRRNGSSGLTLEVGNSVTVVPKNAKTDRVIAIEPGINLWFQKGMGSLIRRRLARFGIDLNSQLRNQQLALRGSLDHSLATVDFSAASDTISKELVRELLPPRWFLLLNSFRSAAGFVDGRPYVWEKFSSMGNGFTFELESLIFFAAALAVKEYLGVDGAVSVFGDDVIIPVQCYDLYAGFCDFLGFTINLSKSYKDGEFRESCGSHYFAGLDVKPLFLKEKVTNAQRVFRLANGIRLLAHRRNVNYGCDRRLLPAWRYLLHRVPKLIRLRAPAIVSDSTIESMDGAFLSNFDEAAPVLARNLPRHLGWEGYFTNTFVHRPVEIQDNSEGLFLARLRGSPDRAYGEKYMLRGRTRVRVNKTLVGTWYDLGPWL